MAQSEQKAGDPVIPGSNKRSVPLPVMLEADGLTRRFGQLVAVDALTLSVTAGEVFGLLGPNGAGKSTAIKMLTTLLPPTAGTARVAGFDIVHQATQVRRVIGYVPQLLSADGALTGYENLLVFANPDESVVIMTQNDLCQELPVRVKVGDKVIASSLEADSFNTFVVRH